MKKIKLSMEYEYDFFIIGMSCHSKDYHLCWSINNKLNINLKKKESISIKLSGDNYEFSHYQDNKRKHILYHVIANKGINGGFFLSEYKQYDYFLIIDGILEDDQKFFIEKVLKKVEIILTLNIIDITSIKSKEHLIF